MISALVVYKEWYCGHPMLDGEWITKSKVVKVNDVTELNEISSHIIDIKILQNGNIQQQTKTKKP